jgi:pyruvate dehydrogenase E1 component alpha subunit
MLTERFNPLEGKMLSIIDKDGNIVDEDLVPKISDEKLLKMYEIMVLTRTSDIKGVLYQSQGRLLTYIPNEGQEAAQIGSAAAIEDRDWLVPSFRETGAWLYKGVPVFNIFLYCSGSEWGSHFPDGVKMLPIAVPIATQLNHAVGIGMSSRIKGEDEVTLTYVGDGGTSEGDFHEALNFAAVFNAPVVFIVQNNQFAISVPRSSQTKSKTLAQKAIAYGIPGIQVDGNDILAVYAATNEAIDRARKGEGPTLIEAVTYRIGPHTTADDSTLYRNASEVEEWKKKDPIVRFKKYLQGRSILTEELDNKIIKRCEDIVEVEIKNVEAVGETKLEDMFIYIYAEMTTQLKQQYRECKEFIDKGVK